MKQNAQQARGKHF